MKRILAGVFLLAVAAGSLFSAGPDTFVFAVLTDPQIGMVSPERDRTNFALAVKAINALPANSRPSLAFVLGDLVHRGGDKSQMDLFLGVWKTFGMPVRAVPGNHDLAADGKRIEAGLLEKFRQEIGPDRFSVEHGGCLFLGLNSQAWADAPDLASEQFRWLSSQLKARNRYRCVFVFQHHSLYTVDAAEKDDYHNTPLAWRGKLLKLFQQARVTAVVSGHLHRNLSGLDKGLVMMSTPSTCRNFDNSPFGYRLFRVTADGFVEGYTGVPGALPDQPAAARK